MKMILIAFCLSVMSLSQVAASSCDGPLLKNNQPIVLIKDLSWVSPNTMIYGLDEGGLYETHLNKSERRILYPLSENFFHFIQIAPDGQKLYFTASKDASYSEPVHHYIYDLLTHSAKPIGNLPLERGRGNLEWIGFSPNSQFLAWQVNPQFAVWQPWTEAPSLLVAQAPDYVAKAYNFPTDLFQTETVISCFPSQWGLDSSSIYSNLYEGSGQCILSDVDENKLKYFKTALKTGQTTRLSGGYEFDTLRWRFKNYYREGKQSINLTYPCGSHHCELSRDEPLKDHMSEARISWDNDGAPIITIMTNQKQVVELKTPIIKGCGDPSLVMVSWVDEGNYLIFEYNEKTYLYGIQENKLSLLPQLTGVYVWTPQDRTPYLATQAGRKNRERQRYFIPAFIGP